MDDHPDRETAAALAELNRQYAAMPPVAAMAMRATAFDGERLVLHAPLAANVNDKGCAFGGSLASAMTLAGWGLAVLALRAVGQRADVYVADSQIRYLAPLYDDLVAEATLADGETWPAVLDRLQARGRARTAVVARARDATGTIVATLEARFALMTPGARRA